MKKAVAILLLFCLGGCTQTVNIKCINNTANKIRVISLAELINFTEGGIVSIPKGDSSPGLEALEWTEGSIFRELPLFFYIVWADTNIVDAGIRSYNELKRDNFRLIVSNNFESSKKIIKWYIKGYLMEEGYFWENDENLTYKVLEVALFSKQPSQIYQLMEKDSIIQKMLNDLYSKYKNDRLNRWKFLDKVRAKLSGELELERTIGADELANIYQKYRKKHPLDNE